MYLNHFICLIIFSFFSLKKTTNKTETKLAEYSKMLEERNAEIICLSGTITELNVQTHTLTSQLDRDNTRIEDLEFQIEEHKLGCIEKNEEEAGAGVGAEGKVDGAVSLVITGEEVHHPNAEEQLKMQLDVCRGLREQVEAMSIDIKQLKYGAYYFKNYILVIFLNYLYIYGMFLYI